MHLVIINIVLVPKLVFEVFWLHGNNQFCLERDSLPVGMTGCYWGLKGWRGVVSAPPDDAGVRVNKAEAFPGTLVPPFLWFPNMGLLQTTRE